jgi:hypothetical protein
MGATATTEVSTATPTAEVRATAAATTAKMSTTTTTAAETAASRVSRSRQTKGKAYCSRACCDFPHDTTSSSGLNAGNQRRIARSVPAARSSRCCNAHVTVVHFAHHSRCG